MSGGYIYGTLLTANNSLAKMNRIFGWSVALNILFNFLLIPKYGALGAAWTTILTQAFALVGQIILAKKAFALTTDIPLLGRLFFMAMLMVGLSFLLINNSVLPWMLNYVIALMAGISLGFLLGLLNVNAFLQLLKAKTDLKK